MRRKHIHFNPQHIKSRNCSYLQDLAPLRVAVHVLTGMKHAQCHTVQQDHQHGRSLEPRGGQRLRNTTGNRRQQLACQWHEPGGYSNNKHILLQLLSSDLIIPFKCMNSPDTAVHVCLFRYHFTITKCLQEEKGATEESGSLQGLTCGKKKVISPLPSCLPKIRLLGVLENVQLVSGEGLRRGQQRKTLREREADQEEDAASGFRHGWMWGRCDASPDEFYWPRGSVWAFLMWLG